jgi:hypothetical protein
MDVTNMDVTNWRQLTEHNLSDDAGGNRDKSIVGAYLDPMITSRRSTQVMAAPIIDYVMSAAIFARKALASVQVMPRAGPPLVIVCAHMVVTVIGLKAMTAIVPWTAMLTIVIVTVIVLMIIVLGESGASR